jgi:hypothetical protein
VIVRVVAQTKKGSIDKRILKVARRLSDWGAIQWLTSAMLLTGAAGRAAAQEAVRFSLASEAAAQSREQSLEGLDRSTLRTQRIGVSVSTALDAEGNDNINMVADHRLSDFISRAQVGTRVAWVASEENVVQLALDAGYSFYALHSEWDRFFIQPGSELSFDVYMGEWWVNFHDRLAVTENAYDDPTLAGAGNYSQLRNTAGLSGTWDLNKLQLNIQYDHAIYSSLTGSSLPDGRSDIFGLNAALKVMPMTTIGMQLGGGSTHYDGTKASDSANLNAGAFARAQPMQYLGIYGTAGYTVYTDQNSDRALRSSYDAFYWQIGLNHRINRFLDYNLTGGRTICFGFFSGTVDMYSAAMDGRLHCFRNLGVSFGLLFEHGTVLSGTGETFDRLGHHVCIERTLNRKLSATLRYQYFARTSDLTGGDYELNVLTATLVYRL